jgi:hypothetical protein
MGFNRRKLEDQRREAACTTLKTPADDICSYPRAF